METLVGRFRKLFAAKKQRIPAFIQIDVDPKKHWNIHESIGEGSFGAVKKVSSKEDPKVIAAFKCTEIQEGEEIEDLAIEVEILTTCKHENVVDILAAYYHDNCLSVMLEYCAGGAVDNIIQELDKAFTEPQIASLIHQVTNGLDFLHGRYIIHRDMKAGNLLLTGDGTAKIADFGVSAVLSGPDDGSNTFIGTPHWMPPEVIRCETTTNVMYNCKADIWALGITCIQLAQKEPPYHELSAERVRLKILRAQKPPLLDHPSAWSVSFNDFISRCLMINPASRCTAANLMTHPFIANATNKKPLVILLLEMTADFSEEPVFDNGSYAGSVCSSDGTSVYSRLDDSSKNTSANVSGEGATLQETAPATPATPMRNPSASPKKKRMAPAPPVSLPQSPDMRAEPSKSERLFLAVNEEPSKSTSTSQAVTDQGQFSPSRLEACEILNDLDDVLDQNYSNPPDSRHSSQSSLSVSEHKSPSPIRRKQSEPLSDNKSSDGASATVIQCTTPTHAIRDTVSKFNSPASKSPVSMSSSSLSYESDQRPPSSPQHLPVLVRVNGCAFEEPLEPKSQAPGTTDDDKKQAADIPNGLVKMHRELAQRELLADRARDEAQRIKEQRRREEAELFSEQVHVADIAASFANRQSSDTPETSAPSSRTSSRREVLPTRSIAAAAAVANSLAEGDLRNQVQPATAVYSEPKDEFNATNGAVSPPPEPPVDYDETPKAPFQSRTALPPLPSSSTPKSRPQVQNVPAPSEVGKENSDPQPRLIRRTPSRQTATKKTRRFMVDGVEMTSTTLHEIEAKAHYNLRREQEREYQRMQREETRQRFAHEKKSAAMQQEQERQFTIEKQMIEKAYQNEIELIARTQKRKIEEIEKQQEDEVKQVSKRLKSEQERRIRMFKDQLNREQKVLKQEIEMLPRSQRREIYRYRKELLDKNQAEREIEFMVNLDREHEIFVEQLRANHREKMAYTERQFLEEKHKIEQGVLTRLWELEERQLTERHGLNQKQLQELYFLQRSQMIARHQKELECVQRMVLDEEQRLNRDLAANKKNLPKSLRAESKVRIRMYKEALQIGHQNPPERWDQLVAEFEEKEKQRIKKTILEYDEKCKRRLDSLLEVHQRMIKDLEHIQSEKRAMLSENEQSTLAECEQQFQQLLKESRASRPQRKAELERRFKDEMEKQIKFYNMAGASG